VPLLMVWQRGAGLTCNGTVPSFLSGNICPKPEVLGVRLVSLKCRCVAVFRVWCALFCDDFIIDRAAIARCDLLHNMAS
jgi:hypothetical protein